METDILGLDRDVVVEFLRLFRDVYPKIDKANYFLELHTGTSGLNIAVTNVRDAVSHLVTALQNPDWPREQQIAQLNHAEEHLRRALIEPYGKAVSLAANRVFNLLERYKQRVLPRRGEGAYANAPDLDSINTRLKAIKGLRERGRAAKGRNRFDAQWEAGVADFVTAFEELHKLESELERHLVVADAAAKSRKALAWTVVGVVLGLAGIVLAWMGLS